jgi:hypothetical protein
MGPDGYVTPTDMREAITVHPGCLRSYLTVSTGPSAIEGSCARGDSK